MKISNFKFQISNLKQGFTLIELLVVITIIAILATLGFTSYTAVTRSGRDALRKSNIEQIRSALEIYRAQNSIYPATSSCGAAPAGLTNAYINIYPTDPVGGQSYCYSAVGAGSGYQLCASLENSAAGGLCGGAACGGLGCNYQVINP